MKLPLGMSLKQFIAHLKTLDFEVSLIQLQTSCCIDGVSKQELLWDLRCVGFHCEDGHSVPCTNIKTTDLQLGFFTDFLAVPFKTTII